MKKIIYIFVFFIIFKPVLPILEYVIFYDYIKNELCVNKDNSDFECNGMCHLDKELSKVSDSENPFSTDKNNRPLLEFSVLFFEDFQEVFFDVFSENKIKEPLIYCNLYSHLFTDSVFHPPSKF